MCHRSLASDNGHNTERLRHPIDLDEEGLLCGRQIIDMSTSATTGIEGPGYHKTREDQLAGSDPAVTCLQWGHTKVATMSQSSRPT